MAVYTYFDHAASSPQTPACRDALAAFDAHDWAGANPNSLHGWGRSAYQELERARQTLARCMGARRPSEVVFTSGGTESNNIAIAGALEALSAQPSSGPAGAPRRRRVIVSAIEHDSVLDAAQAICRRLGFAFETAPVDSRGFIDLDALNGLLAAGDVALVSVMAANNEVGTVQPIERVVRLAHAAGALVHTDAVQAFGHIPFDAAACGVDVASVTAHKLGGPVGIGALYLKARTPFRAQTVGGGQEGGLRSGTPDVRGASAFAAVARDACEHLDERARTCRALADFLVRLCCSGPDTCARPTVDLPRGDAFLPGIVHLVVGGHQSEGLVLGLDELGFAVSGGSACSSASLEPSHVLTAMGVPRDEAFCALRLSFDHRTTPEDCERLAEALKRVCAEGARRN